jgi:hypothetical protein
MDSIFEVLMTPSPMRDGAFVHCMHHFGRLKPHSGIVADTTENLAQ